MRRLFFVLASLVLFSSAGCLWPNQAPEPIPAADSLRKFALLQSADRGVIALVFVPHPLSPPAPPCGVQQALQKALPTAPCSAAVFLYSETTQAESWLATQCELREKSGLPPRVMLAGHSWGATAAGEFAQRIFQKNPRVIIQLLATVDAVKSSTVGTTTGITSTVLTLGNPIPGKNVYFIAYDGTPRVDGKRLLAHTNYYQLETTLYHGGPIGGKVENMRIRTSPSSAVNHGNVDDYAMPFLTADFIAAIREGAGK